MSTTFELAKRMLYTEERIAAPLHYFTLFAKLTPEQQRFLVQESESLSQFPDPVKEGKRRLNGGRLRKPGGGRKQLGARSDYITALKQAVVLQSPESSLSYSTQSARAIAAAMKKQGHACSSASIPKLAETAGMRIHPRIKPSPRIKRIEPADQFEFIGNRLDHVLSRDTGAALFITADPLSKTPYNCPAERLDSWRAQALTSHVQEFLYEWESDVAARKINELMFIVEGGGLLGLRNAYLPRKLQAFADQTGVTIFLSHLPSGLSRISTDPLLEETLALTREDWKLGSVRLRICNVKPSFLPFSPRDGNFRPTSWNRIFRPTTPEADSFDDSQTTSSRNDIQDAAPDD